MIFIFDLFIFSLVYFGGYPNQFIKSSNFYDILNLHLDMNTGKGLSSLCAVNSSAFKGLILIEENRYNLIRNGIPKLR